MKEEITDIERFARRRIGYITPWTAGKVLAHGRYWTLPFLRLYLEHCDERAFHDPEEGYLLGQHGAELARRVPIRGPGGYGSRLARDSWRVRALAVWGSCCRAYGELTQAESAYRLAQELAEGRELDPECLGEMHARIGVLAMTLGRADAVERVSRAVACFERCESSRIADALTIRGLARYLERQDPECLMDLVRALELVDSRDARGARTLTALLHNMALVVSRGGVDIGAQELAYRLLTEVKGRLPRSRSVQKAKIAWVEGLLLARLGITRLAERRLSRARRSFEIHGEAFELAAVSLDLVCFYLEEGNREAAEELAEETRSRVVELAEDPGLIEAAERWRGHVTADGSHALKERFWRRWSMGHRRTRPVGLL